MFLNYANCINDYIGRVKANNAHLMIFGHAHERYETRFVPLQNVIHEELLNEEVMLDKCLDLIQRKYYKKCVNPNGVDKVRNVIRDEVHLMCERYHFIVDISILVDGTEVAFWNRKPMIILDQYKELCNNRILKLGDKVIAIETVNTTIRLHKERNLNFGNQPTLCELGLPKKVYNVEREDILAIAHQMLIDEQKEGHEVADQAKRVIERFQKEVLQ